MAKVGYTLQPKTSLCLVEKNWHLSWTRWIVTCRIRIGTALCEQCNWICMCSATCIQSYLMLRISHNSAIFLLWCELVLQINELRNNCLCFIYQCWNELPFSIWGTCSTMDRLERKITFCLMRKLHTFSLLKFLICNLAEFFIF